VLTRVAVLTEEQLLYVHGVMINSVDGLGDDSHAGKVNEGQQTKVDD